MKCQRPLRCTRRNARGQSLVEFALVALYLLPLLYFIVEMCRLVLVYSTVVNAARVGVRYASVHGSNSPPVASIQTVVNGYLSAATIDPGDATVYVCYAASLSTYPTCSSSATPVGDPGTAVTVSVSYPYRALSSYVPFRITLPSTSQGVITF